MSDSAKCPIDHSKLSAEQWQQMKAAHSQHVTPAQPIEQPVEQLVTHQSANQDAAKCPIDHTKLSAEQWQQMKAAHSPSVTQPTSQPITQSVSQSSENPLKSAEGCDSTQLNDASFVNDNFPDAKMTSPNQKIPLSSAAVESTIPRSGIDPKTGKPFEAGSKWVYPSPQRFFNAMDKKGWQPNEREMPYVVSIHNTVNERTWSLVQQWEKMHSDECADGPRLARFKGRPNDLSIKARFNSTFLGYTAPFDRHDWYVDRCGKEVRYVIDFYPGQGGMSNSSAIHLDVRPAIDSPTALFDRMRRAISDRWADKQPKQGF